jgi:hypothetical protein
VAGGRPPLATTSLRRKHLALAESVELYLERHAPTVRARTIATLRDRLRHSLAAFGDVPLHELERMPDVIAGWQAKLPRRAGHGIAQALRQVLDAVVRRERMSRNPAKLAGRNPKPAPRSIRAFTFDELDAIAVELPPMYRPLPTFAAATGLRPEEWQALERREVDRAREVDSVARTVSSGEAVELARVMGTSIEMIERHYGVLLDGSGAGIAGRLAAFEAQAVDPAEATGD